MNMKLNTICFILLLFLLIGIVSANENNDGILHKIEQPNIVEMNINKTDTTLSKSLQKDIPLQATSKSISTNSKTSSKAKVSLKASDVNMYYGDGSKFKVTLKDNNKKVMKNTKLTVNINDKTYNKKTNSEGKILLNLNFNSGKYKVTTTYPGSSKYTKKSISNTITIKSTIKANDLTKYYKNKKSYTATLYDTKGNPLKKTKIKYQIDNTIKSSKTNSKGELSININLKPGPHIIYLSNPKSNEVAARHITIKNTIEYYSYNMDNNALVTYSVKVLNSDGKPIKNKKVLFKVNNNQYSVYSNNNGIATLLKKFDVGSYMIISKYDGQEIKYQFEVYQASQTNPTQDNQKIQNPVKKTNFTHSISIPDSVNVTTDYVFQNEKYTLKTGYDGIIKMPKNDVFKVVINDTIEYNFCNSPINGFDANILDGSCYLIPFDGSPISHKYNKNSLIGEGILIYNENGNNIIEYRSSSQTSTDLFGVFLSNFLYGETISYVQDNKIKAQITFITNNYDNQGVKYNLNKMNGQWVYDVNSQTYTIIDRSSFMRYAQNNRPIQFSSFGFVIPEQLSNEKINTKLSINGVDEFEKIETISYGQNSKYKSTMGFEVLQSFAIVNDKVTENNLNEWRLKNESYLYQVGLSNVYGMFLSALETVWIADELANQNTIVYNVTWQRDIPTVVMGGLNLEDTYIHILNSAMGMNVKGSDENATLFKLINSFYLTDIEEYVISTISEQFNQSSINSMDEVISAIGSGEFSIAQYDDLIYIFTENDKNSSIIFNTTSAVLNVISVKDGVAYKGSLVQTKCDCCSIIKLPELIIEGVRNIINDFKEKGLEAIGIISKYTARLSVLSYYLGNFAIKSLNAFKSFGLFGGALSGISSMLAIHSISKYVRDEFFDKDDWHFFYSHLTFSRDSILENKKVFTIPNSDGGYDYIEVEINKDGSLNRDNAIFISENTNKKISSKETYNYFKEESWVPWSIPRKYQPHPVPF